MGTQLGHILDGLKRRKIAAAAERAEAAHLVRQIEAAFGGSGGSGAAAAAAAAGGGAAAPPRRRSGGRGADELVASRERLGILRRRIAAFELHEAQLVPQLRALSESLGAASGEGR